MKSVAKIIVMAIMASVCLSCSTTRVLQDGEFRLADNRIEVENDKNFNSSQLKPYLKQQPNSYFIFGWNPFLNIYNWSNGKGKGWDRFVKKIGVEPVVYDYTLVESSIENIEDRLEYLGYYGSTVNSEVKVKRKNVDVTYKVNLGKRFPISDIEIVLPKRGEFAGEFLRDTSSMTVKKGDWLSEASLEAETERAASVMRDKGFYTFNKNYFFFEADTTSSPGSAILTMTVNEYTRNENPREARPISRYYINDVKLSYPKTLKIKEESLYDLNTIIPGDLYSEKCVNNTYSRFSSVKLFSSVNIGMDQVDTNLVDCSISLAQSKLQGFKINFEASSNSTGLLGFSPQLSYYHKNIFKGGEWLNLSFMSNNQFKINDDIRSNELGVSAGLSFPRFFPLPYSFFKEEIPRTEVNISYNYQNRPEYTRNMISTSYGYKGSAVGGRLYYQIYPMQLNIIRLFDLNEGFFNTLANDPFLRNAYQDHFDLGSGGIIYYTTNSDTNPKTSYWYSRFQFDIAGNILSAFKPMMKKDQDGHGMVWDTPFSQYVRGELTLSKTWAFGKRKEQSVATRLLAGAGYAYGNSSALPFEKHFYGGGANSLRGWQARTVGPGMAARDSSFVIPNQTGDMRLEANIEYRFNMFWKVEGAVFADAGNVWTLNNNDVDQNEKSIFRWDRFGESIAANWGCGLRLDFGFLLIRLDMGFKVHDPAREHSWVSPRQWFTSDGYALHFGVGYPF